jgi:hypothetical protein
MSLYRFISKQEGKWKVAADVTEKGNIKAISGNLLSNLPQSPSFFLGK